MYKSTIVRDDRRDKFINYPKYPSLACRPIFLSQAYADIGETIEWITRLACSAVLSKLELTSSKDLLDKQ